MRSTKALDPFMMRDDLSRDLSLAIQQSINMPVVLRGLALLDREVYYFGKSKIFIRGKYI